METKNEGRICSRCNYLAIHSVEIQFSTEKTTCQNCGVTYFNPAAIQRAA